MKISTKQHNTKHKLVVTGALAAIVGLSAPAAVTFAQGSNGERTNGSDKSSHHRGDGKRGHKHDGKHNLWSLPFTAEQFTDQHDTTLERYDSFITGHELTVENGEELKASAQSSAETTASELTDLKELRDSIGNPNEASSEQRSELKAQAKATTSAYIDYTFALNEYKLAIKAAADEAEVDVKGTIKFES